VASDLDDGSLSGVVVTPVRPFELWLGKWLGLVVLNGLLLAILLGIVALQLFLRGVPVSDLAPSQRILPSEASLDEHASRILAQMESAALLPKDRDRASLRREVLARLRTEHLSVNPGESHQWRFDWSPRAFRPGTTVRIQLDALSSFGTAAGVMGNCRVLDAQGKDIATFGTTMDDGRHIVHSLPASRLGESPTITVRIENNADSDGAAVLVRASDGATLLVPRGTFAGNLLATGVVLWTMLAALAAVGVTAGTMFSLPVAVFVASAFTVIGILAHADVDSDAGCGHDHGQEEAGQASTAPCGTFLLRGVAFVTEPITAAAPLDRLGDKVRIEPPDVWRALGVVGLALPMVFALAGAAVLRRREFP
jgi:hypothetical protein